MWSSNYTPTFRPQTIETLFTLAISSTINRYLAGGWNQMAFIAKIVLTPNVIENITCLQFAQWKTIKGRISRQAGCTARASWSKQGKKFFHYLTRALGTTAESLTQIYCYGLLALRKIQFKEEISLDDFCSILHETCSFVRPLNVQDHTSLRSGNCPQCRCFKRWLAFYEHTQFFLFFVSRFIRHICHFRLFPFWK